MGCKKTLQNDHKNPYIRIYGSLKESYIRIYGECLALISNIPIFDISWYRSTGRYRSHIGINIFSHQIYSWCGLQRILVIILSLLPVCSHHHCCHHAVAAQHSFLGEIMISINKKMFDTPTKKKNGKSVSKVGKKTDYVQSRNITGVQVISVHCIDYIC